MLAYFTMALLQGEKGGFPYECGDVAFRYGIPVRNRLSLTKVSDETNAEAGEESGLVSIAFPFPCHIIKRTRMTRRRTPRPCRWVC